MSDLPRITETWHWDEGDYAAGEAPYMGRSKFGKWVTVEHAADIIVEYQQRLAAAEAENQRVRAGVSYWSYCLSEGMRHTCPEKVEELMDFLISLKIAPYYMPTKGACGE